VLPLETLKTFMALGIEAPKGSEDVPRAIAAVEAKKAEYEAKRDKAAAEPPSEEEEPAEVRGAGWLGGRVQVLRSLQDAWDHAARFCLNSSSCACQPVVAKLGSQSVHEVRLW
jgi:hypothetical protein